MNRNIDRIKAIEELSELVKNLDTTAEISIFFKELLTESELDTLSKRWRILTMLKDGYTQREIAKELQSYGINLNVEVKATGTSSK